MTTLPLTGLSLSNMVNRLGVGSTPPYRISSLYNTAGVAGFYGGATLPAVGQRITYGIFRGVTKATFTSHTFTNAGATGVNGPTLAQCRTAYSSASWVNNTNDFNMTTQGIQLFKVPYTGNYSIEAAGASSGNDAPRHGTANGYVLRATFSLTAGQWLSLLVGQRGTDAGAYGGGGGGGGSFVVQGGNLLMVAGGAGGTGNYYAYGMTSPAVLGFGDGYGGVATYNGGGGAGWYSNGASGSGGGGGGATFTNGGVGGAGNGQGGAGGFGGGGGGGDWSGWVGGGGGGFSGGYGGSHYSYDGPGGPGTCYCSVGITADLGATRNGHGYITITRL